MNTRGPFHNTILDALPMDECHYLAGHLIPMNLVLGHNLYGHDNSVRQLYFPIEGIVSMVYNTSKGATAEVTIIGNEGVVGLSALLSGDVMAYQAVVQAEGIALRLNGALFRTAFRRFYAVQDLVLSYQQAEFTQVAQTAVCNRHHTVEQQLCRWILMSLDRLPSNRLIMTQDLIANMLGVRREEVSRAASRLQRQGLIKYQRGTITVPDRRLLEQGCCECYAVVKAAFDRLPRYTAVASPCQIQ